MAMLTYQRVTNKIEDSSCFIIDNHDLSKIAWGTSHHLMGT